MGFFPAVVCQKGHSVGGRKQINLSFCQFFSVAKLKAQGLILNLNVEILVNIFTKMVGNYIYDVY